MMNVLIVHIQNHKINVGSKWNGFLVDCQLFEKYNKNHVKHQNNVN